MTVRKVSSSAHRPSRWCLAMLFAATGMAALGLVATGWLGGYRINMTPSEPLGLWRIVPLDRPAGVGDLLFICPPETPVMQQARDRGYLRRGLCAAGYAPLVKTVIAIPGQWVKIGSSIQVDGQETPGSQLVTADGKGRPLLAFGGGKVPTGSVFVHSSFPASWDSRYFGPIPASGILGLAQEVLTYAP